MHRLDVKPTEITHVVESNLASPLNFSGKAQNLASPAMLKTRARLNAWLLLSVIHQICFASHLPQSNEYGPQVRGFLDYLRQEEIELRFMVSHREISRKEYVRSMNRIAVWREAVLSYARKTGKDCVPEFHIVTTSEVDELIPDGTKALKGIKLGEVIAEKWRYIGSSIRGERFYIFQRLAGQKRGCD
jgi:hypothetical protein